MSSEVGYFEMAVYFIGGLGMFIYGMHIMASGLQKSAGNKMKKLLELLTTNKFLGVIVGTAVTAIIQSSSATTVMVVGFVNAGVMNITQAVGVIMGANIGTTVTSWLVASMEWAKYLNPVQLAPLAVGIGAAMVLFSHKDKVKLIGEIIVGFGILFIGMQSMSTAVAPLSDSEVFRQIFLTLGANPFLGILAGAGVTAIIQSSSASVGILQSLALSGLVPWNAAVYIIMGQNIGTCVTAIISGIGASKNAKSAAYVHLIFNIMGSVVFSIIAIIYFTFINAQLGNSLISITEISVVHTSFNIANTIILYPFSGILIIIAQKMANVKQTPIGDEELIHLDDRILETPSFAIESCFKELIRMAEMANENLILSTEALLEKDNAKIEKVFIREKNIDKMEQAITNYLVKLCNKELSQEQSNIITSLFHTVSDVERVGDYSENVAELAEMVIDSNIIFSESAMSELNEIISATKSCFKNSIDSLELGEKDLAKKVMEEEELIDVLEKKFRSSHIQRLSNNECNSTAGVLYLDTITNLERISDHALNIAEMVMDIRLSRVKDMPGKNS